FRHYQREQRGEQEARNRRQHGEAAAAAEDDAEAEAQRDLTDEQGRDADISEALAEQRVAGQRAAEQAYIGLVRVQPLLDRERRIAGGLLQHVTPPRLCP